MKSVNSCCVKQALAVAVMAACASLSAQAGEPGSVDKSVLAQVMALNGLDERGAIERLAAEEAGADSGLAFDVGYSDVSERGIPRGDHGRNIPTWHGHALHGTFRAASVDKEIEASRLSAG